jgi:uncharacterized protein RhaS with RHS repeats
MGYSKTNRNTQTNRFILFIDTLGCDIIVTGQRVSKAGPTTITGTNYYVYDEAGQMLGEYDANAKPIQETVYLGEMPLAVLKQETNITTNQIDTKLNYIHTDHLNTPRVITRAEDGNGKLYRVFRDR